jgi:hypothetical protein
MLGQNGVAQAPGAADCMLDAGVERTTPTQYKTGRGSAIMGISRRAVLGGFGHSATLGALAAALTPQLRAAQAAAAAQPAPPAPAAAPAAPAATYCLATMYGQAAGVTFDGDAFRDKHLTLLKSVYGDRAERIELRMPAPTPEGAPQPLFIATVNIWFRDVQEFIKRNGAAAKDIAASLEAVTKAPLIGQVDQVVSERGEGRLASPIDSLCVSNYFPAKDGATFDAPYFADTFFPKMAEQYGTTAIRRIEVSKGAAGAAGGKPSLLHTAHIYINDVDAYTEAEGRLGAGLLAELEKYTNIKPRVTLTRLHAIG